MAQESGVEQIAEIIGRKTETVMVGGGEVTLRLRPMRLVDYIELGQQDFATSLESLLYQAHVCAVRGGFEGTKEELAGLIEGDEIIALEQAVETLAPLLMARGRARMGLAPAETDAAADATSRVPTGDGEASSAPSGE